jgi:hypothetical protein
MNNITKDQFVAVLESAGINAAQREQLHREFERRHPAAHEKFLAWLGIAAAEAARIREHSRAAN